MRPPPVLAIGWLAAGLSWAGASVVPWTSSGSLSQSSLVDAVRLVRQGVVGDVVPSAAAVLLLVPAMSGVVLIAAAGAGGRPAAVVRLVAAVVGVVAVVVLLVQLTGGSPDRAGLGASVALAGTLVALASGTAQTVLAISARRRVGAG